MNENGEDWMFQEINKNGEDEDFVIAVIWFARAWVMKEINNLLYFNFVGKSFTTVANTNHSEIQHI